MVTSPWTPCTFGLPAPVLVCWTCAPITVKFAGALSAPATEATTVEGPAAMCGTCTLIEVAVQDLTAVAVEPNFRVLVPWLAPKFVPLMVMKAPGEPEGGEIDVIAGPRAVPASVVSGEGVCVPWLGIEVEPAGLRHLKTRTSDSTSRAVTARARPQRFAVLGCLRTGPKTDWSACMSRSQPWSQSSSLIEIA